MSETRVPCHWGLCTHWVNEATNVIDSGVGPVLCPCDHLPGWRSKYVEGQARPAAPVKVRGRHGSRVQRSRRRHRLPAWGAAFGGWLPAVAELERVSRRDVALKK